jgi:hypothetical protein
MGQGKIESSLLPHEIRQAKIWREKSKWFATAALVFLAAAGVKYGTYYVHNDKFEGNAGVQRTIDATVAQAEKADRAWQDVESSGGPDKTRIINVNSLQMYRDMWADLWLDVTQALPKKNAMSPDEIKSTPRAEREQLFIETVNSQYQANISGALKMDDQQFKMLAQPSSAQGSGGAGAAAWVDPSAGRLRGGGGGARDDGGNLITPNRFQRAAPVAATPAPGEEGAAGELRGYLITLQCTSPNRNAPVLLESTLIKQLLERVSQTQALKDHKNYYVARAMIVAARQINSDEARKTVLKTAYDKKRLEQEKAQGPQDPLRQQPNQAVPPRGRQGAFVRPGITGRGDGGGAAASDKNDKDAYLDPLFPGESVLNDWALTVVIAVVLDPKAPPEGAAGTQTASVDPAVDDRRAAASR